MQSMNATAYYEKKKCIAPILSSSSTLFRVEIIIVLHWSRFKQRNPSQLTNKIIISSLLRVYAKLYLNFIRKSKDCEEIQFSWSAEFSVKLISIHISARPKFHSLCEKRKTSKLRQISMTVLKCRFINKYSCNTITPRLRQWTEVRKVDKKKSEMASKQETTGVSRSREIISFFLYKNSVKCFQCALKNIFFFFIRSTNTFMPHRMDVYTIMPRMCVVNLNMSKK